MKNIARNRRIGYMVFLALVFLIIITLPGFHDNSFIKRLIAYLILNLLFSVWILRSNVLLRIVFGLLIGSLSAIISFYVQSLFFSILSDAITAAILFFVIFGTVFISLWEFTLFLFLKRRKSSLN